jgi:hypothetical protein
VSSKSISIYIVFFLICVSIIVAVTIYQDGKNIKEKCQEYCKCQVISNCSYTFDYDEVKGCDCDVRY